MGLHGAIYDRWAKDSCGPRFDCIKTVEIRPYRIESYCGARECKHASGVSNFAQTPDGQRRNLIFNRYAIARRPWEEATRLAAMPKAIAERALVSTLDRVLGKSRNPSETEAIP